MVRAVTNVALFSILRHFNVDTALMELCPFPWMPYHTKRTFCQIKCAGNAFHSPSGQLMCFNGRDVATPRPTKNARSLRNTTCDCGYFVKRLKSNWTSCDIPLVDISVKDCKALCERTTVYLYKRSKKKTIVFCERDERSEFYEMTGEASELRIYENVQRASAYQYWECLCGIRDVDLKPSVRKSEKMENSHFEECLKPWESIDLLKVVRFETCASTCRQICNRGLGFYHKGSPLCFSKCVPTRRRSRGHGAIDGLCECGYFKQLSKHRRDGDKSYQFIPCDPPTTRNNLVGRDCSLFCAKSKAYIIHAGLRKPLTIRCIYKPDTTWQKPRPLFGKCDERIYAKEVNSVTQKYHKCRCGLRGTNIGDKIPTNESGVDVKIELPDSWPIKKKRSARPCEKCHQKAE